MRVGVYIDGSNMLRTAAAVRPDAQFSLGHVIEWTLESYFPGATLASLVARVGRDLEPRVRDSLGSYADHAAIDFVATDSSPETIRCDCGADVRHYREREVDTGLTACMVRDALGSVVDALLLFSHDRDLRPACELARSTDREVNVAGWAAHLSDALMVSGQWIDLSDAPESAWKPISLDGGALDMLEAAIYYQYHVYSHGEEYVGLRWFLRERASTVEGWSGKASQVDRGLDELIRQARVEKYLVGRTWAIRPAADRPPPTLSEEAVFGPSLDLESLLATLTHAASGEENEADL